MTIGGPRSDVKLPKCGQWPPSNTGIRGDTRDCCWKRFK